MVLSGRAFLRRHKDDHGLGVRIVFYMIKLAKGTKSDLHVWLDFFFSYFNVSSMFSSRDYFSSDELRMYTKASGSIGYSATFIFGNECSVAE